MHGTDVPQAFPGEQAVSSALDDLVARVHTEVSDGLAPAGWAEDEIAQAIRRHPGAENDLWHSYRLLVPTVSSAAWTTEFVFRGHARELLERVAAGQDTRPGTAAECCMAMARVSQEIPLHGAAAGFYHRMWGQAFPGHRVWEEAGAHYEALHRQAIDDHERDVRRRLAVPSRRLAAAEIECGGSHWSKPVTCKYRRQPGEQVAA